jgi:hypothetical protein
MWKVPRIFDYDQLGIRDSFGQNRAGILQWHRFICISTYNEGRHLHAGQAIGKVESEKAPTSCLTGIDGRLAGFTLQRCLYFCCIRIELGELLVRDEGLKNPCLP